MGLVLVMSAVAQVDLDDAAPIALLVVVAVPSVWLAVRGSWLALIMPGVACFLGLLAYANSEPDPPWGGDSDPERLLAVVMLFVSVPWFLVVLVITVAARCVRRTESGHQ
jgi:hypothetical protein